MPNSIFLDKIEVDDQLTKANAIKAETAAADDDDFDDDDDVYDLWLSAFNMPSKRHLRLLM